MFEDVVYSPVRKSYEAVYKAKDERTAAWIADQSEYVELNSEIIGYVFAHKNDVVICGNTNEAAIYLRDKLNHELVAIMAGIQEIDPEYKIKRCISCEVNNIRLRRR